MNDEQASNIEVLREMRLLVIQTVDALPPAASSKPSDEEIAQRRWQMHLGVLMADVIRSFERLAKVNEIRGCIILSRCLYEYRIRSAGYVKHRDKALALFQTARKRHFWDLQRLPALDDATEADMNRDYFEWYKTADTIDENMGLPGVVKMAVDLAEPGDVRRDAKGQYVQNEATSYTIPSWYVHGGPQLIVDLFEDWTDPDNWRYYKETRMTLQVTVLRGTIEHAAMFLIAVRNEFGMDVAPAWRLFNKAFKNAGPDKA